MTGSKQDAFWAGHLGDAYTKNHTHNGIGSQIYFFGEILRYGAGIKSVYEVGANAGLNLDAIKLLDPSIAVSGCDLNENAVSIAKSKGYDVDLCSIFDIRVGLQFDLVFTRGVLVHIDPARLDDVYVQMGKLSRKYILLDEFFSPTPVPINNYMGQDGVLFKRDFGRDIMNRLNLKLISYGFRSKIDPVFPGYDTNWYLFQKS